jgi:hypothetical protein
MNLVLETSHSNLLFHLMTIYHIISIYDYHSIDEHSIIYAITISLYFYNLLYVPPFIPMIILYSQELIKMFF